MRMRVKKKHIWKWNVTVWHFGEKNYFRANDGISGEKLTMNDSKRGARVRKRQKEVNVTRDRKSVLSRLFEVANGKVASNHTEWIRNLCQRNIGIGWLSKRHHKMRIQFPFRFNGEENKNWLSFVPLFGSNTSKMCWFGASHFLSAKVYIPFQFSVCAWVCVSFSGKCLSLLLCGVCLSNNMDFSTWKV